jgi:curved DNA-binding protein CbpA
MLPVDCETKDLYQLLGLPAYPAGKTCSASQIKKAYYAMALRHHPDKQSVGADSTAVTDLFQRINFAYSVLSDEQKRLQYDSTGRIGYAGGEEGVVDWLKYFNGLSLSSL